MEASGDVTRAGRWSTVEYPGRHVRFTSGAASLPSLRSHTRPAMPYIRSLPRHRAAPLALAITVVAGTGCGISQDDEVEIGREHSVKVEQQVPILRDARSASYLDSVGQEMAQRADTRELKWQ